MVHAHHVASRFLELRVAIILKPEAVLGVNAKTSPTRLDSGWLSAVGSGERTIWNADAHRGENTPGSNAVRGNVSNTTSIGNMYAVTQINGTTASVVINGQLLLDEHRTVEQLKRQVGAYRRSAETGAFSLNSANPRRKPL